MTQHPAVSALLITYNHERFVAESVRSILAQEGPAFEIVASDDCSTDDTPRELASLIATADPAMRFVAVSTERNSGLGANINRAVSLTHGDILIACAGDDRSRPGRFAKLVAAFSTPDVFAVTSDALKIDTAGNETGRELGWQHDEPIRARAFVAPGVATNGASMAYRREVFDFFGPLQPGVNWEDQVLPFRAALLGRVAWIKEPLVEHRYHGANMSTPLDLGRIPPVEFVAIWHRAALANTIILEQKLADLDRFMAQRPQAEADLLQLRRDLERQINLQKLCTMVRVQPWRALAALLFLSLRGKIPFALAAKQMAMGKFPRLWLWHVRRTSPQA